MTLSEWRDNESGTGMEPLNRITLDRQHWMQPSGCWIDPFPIISLEA